ncbi:MAG TPA: hypothetical protein VJ242_00395 [Patescibacteria group bacterium]|nr:hypothetical protein [Patescibacteria group bacterium]
MGKVNRKSKYIKVKNWAKSYYHQWRKEKTFCPAFNQEILVTRVGWHHLVGSRFRTKVEKIRRFKALPLAKKLIKKATTYQEYRYEHGLHFYSLVAEMEGKRIKVILSSKKKDRKKNFLSVIVLR